jgi:catechol 2,3-dioxygenase-like lactoylglutathione lyase family enzyme
MAGSTDLDHVAVAMEHHADGLPRYVGDLSGRWLSGGLGVGFAPGQVGYANGMRVELLSPNRVEENDFLRRFLDRNGPGPHHLTFKVPDIETAIDRCQEHGLEPVGVDVSDPHWKEAFLHPKQSLGTVVQLAQASGAGWEPPTAPEGLPPPRTPAPATLMHVAHAVRSLDEALRLFGALLEGREVDRGTSHDEKWVELAWPGPGRLRLRTPRSEQSSLVSWLSGRAGRVHHVAFRCEVPGEVPDARPAGDHFVVEPEDNLGTRLLLFPEG